MALGRCQHTIHEHQHHHAWDRDLEPALIIEDGASVEFDTTDASGGQLGPRSTAADLTAIDFGRVNPVSGPVHVLGARPGDGDTAAR